MGSPRHVGIIGTGRIAKECAKILTHSNHLQWIASVVDSSRETLSPDFEQFLQAGNHSYLVSSAINEAPVIDYFEGLEVDLVFSINNHQIIREALLEGIPGGIINFHNAPLPRYAGLNACSWAIYNAESEHGVTWHWVDSGVDSGDIVAQKMFPVPPGSTARSLIMLSISAGIELFGEVVTQCEQGALNRLPQDRSHRLMYSSRDIPGGAQVDFSLSTDLIDRLVRARNFTPLESPLPLPRASIMGRPFFLDEVRVADVESAGTPGLVIRADEVLEIQAADGSLEITRVRDQDGQRIPVASLVTDYGITPGMHIDEESYV